MPHGRKIIFLLLISNFLLTNLVSAATPPIRNMIFFGDSLSDIGNNNWILMNGVVGTPITNPNAQNRKDIWINYLVNKTLNYLVNKTLNKPVYASSRPNLNPLNDNISYAYASADTSDYYFNTDWPQKDPPLPYMNPNCIHPGVIKDAAGNIISTCVPGLIKQVDAYLDSVQYNPNLESIYFIWSGGNDLLNYYTAYMDHSFMKKLLVERFALPSPQALAAVADLAVKNINLAKKQLIDAGVRPEKIYILNLPDLSKTPAVRANNSWALKIFYGKPNLEKSLKNMTQDFNDKLQNQQGGGKYMLPPSHYISISSLFDKILADPARYQLMNTSQSCAAEKATPTCNGYLFYNAKHPTTFTYSILANFIFKQIIPHRYLYDV